MAEQTTSNQPEMSDDTKDHTTDPIKENASSATDGCEKSKLKATSSQPEMQSDDTKDNIIISSSTDVKENAFSATDEDVSPKFNSKDKERFGNNHKPVQPGDINLSEKDLKNFCNEVKFMLHVVNEKEFIAATTYITAPITALDEKNHAVCVNKYTIGMFAKQKVALVQTRPGRNCGEDIEEALREFPEVCYILGVGVCYAFNCNKFEYCDVLVSEKIADFQNYKFDEDRIINRGETRMIDSDLCHIFCKQTDYWSSKFKVARNRKPDPYSKVSPGVFASMPVLVSSKDEKKKIGDAVPEVIGGEMEGSELLKIQNRKDNNVKGVIIIKGVVDYGDEKKGDDWQFTAAMAAFDFTNLMLTDKAGLVETITKGKTGTSSESAESMSTPLKEVNLPLQGSIPLGDVSLPPQGGTLPGDVSLPSQGGTPSGDVSLSPQGGTPSREISFPPQGGQGDLSEPESSTSSQSDDTKDHTTTNKDQSTPPSTGVVKENASPATDEYEQFELKELSKFRKHKLLKNAESCLTLVKIKNGKLKMKSKARNLIRKIEKPIAVLSICGKTRTGKSYFMSRMLGTNDAFKVSNSPEVCTRGIQMATTTLACDKFEVILLDIEGADAGMTEEDDRANLIIKFFALTTLLSSTLVYNTQGVIKKSHIEELRCFSESSRLIHLRDKPISGDESCKDYFPHFFWLMRDDNTEHSDGRSFTDYIKEKYLIPKKGKDSGRSQILSLFPSFTCHKIVRPGGKEPHVTPIEDLDKTFDAGIKNAIIQLCDKIDIKRGLNDVSLTSDMFIHLAEQYIKDLNADDRISDLNLNWKITCQTQLEALSKKLILSYQEEVQKNLKFPVEEGQIEKPDEVTLFGLHSTIKSKMLSQLHQECQKLLPHEKSLTSKIKEDFEEATSKQLTVLRKDNHLQSTDYCSKIFSEIDDTQTLEDRKKLYTDKAKGPAKYNVFKSKTSHISGPPEVYQDLKKNKVTLTWDKPKLNPDAAEKFEIELKEQNGSTWKKLSNDIHSPLDITYSTSKELLPGHVYQVRIRGYNELKRGIGDFSKPQTITIPCGVPNKPLCPRIQLNMDDPTKMTLHVVTLHKLQENGKPVKKIIIQKKTHNNISNLEYNYESNGESTWRGYILNLDNYDKKIPTNFQVIMRNDIGDSVPSEPVALDHSTIIPGPPVNLKHGEITSNSIQLSWEKPKINPLAAHKYEVVCTNTEWRSYTEKCSLEIKNLSPHTEYIFQVKALNSHDFGTQHFLIPVETKLPKPVKPRPVIAVDCDEIFATIKLNKSEEPKELIIMRYDEKKSKLNEDDNIMLDILPLEDEITEVEYKLPYDDKIHFISVQCKNDDAESDSSDLVPVNPARNTKPGNPLNLEEHHKDGNTVILRWDKPKKKARAVTYYRIQMKLSSDDENKWSYLDKLIEENQFTTEIKQLKYCTKYDFRVCAFNINIRGEYSKVLRLTTGCGKPAKPLRPSIEYDDYKALVLTIEPISFEDKFITHVIIEHQHANDREWKRFMLEIDESRRYQIPNDIASEPKELNFRIRLKNDAGESEPSNPCSISTRMNVLIPGAIENIGCESKTGNSIDIYWDKPNINSYAVTGYCIKMKKKDEYEWWKIMESDEPKIKVTGLEENTEYEFEICAKGPFNDGIYHPLEGKTIEVFPGKPTNLRAHKKREDRIKYRWEPPNEHPEAVAYYEVEWKHHKSDTSIKKKVTEASRSIVISGLKSNTYYDIHVTACNKFNNHHPDSSILLEKADTRFSTPTRILLTILAGLTTLGAGGIAAYYATKPDPKKECQSSDEEYY